MANETSSAHGSISPSRVSSPSSSPASTHPRSSRSLIAKTSAASDAEYDGCRSRKRRRMLTGLTGMQTADTYSRWRVRRAQVQMRYEMRDEILRLFGDRLRELRMERSLSQERLAELAGLDRNYIGQIERAERNVALVNIIRIAKALEIEPGELFASFATARKRSGR